MEFLKSIFGDNSLTYAEFEAALQNNKEIKLANLASGLYVGKDKLEKSEFKANELQTQLNAANDAIKGFKDLDVDGLKNGIKTWEKKYMDDTKALQDKLIKQTKDSKIDFALMNAKAKNVKAVRALLDHDKITIDGDNLIGLSDQLSQITKDNPYLFGDGNQNPPPPAGGTTPPDVSKMSDDEYYAYMTKKKE